MTQTWPPSPCVEEEEVALAKEYVPGVAPRQSKNEDQPANSRGSVDQYPIIDDSDAVVQPSDTRKAGSVPTKAGKETAGNSEKRFVLLPSPDVRARTGGLTLARGLTPLEINNSTSAARYHQGQTASNQDSYRSWG